MSAVISPLIVRHFRRCGYSEKTIATFTGETRLFQDIGIFGDNAYDELNLLRKEFDIDFSAFEFKKYFPGNFGVEPLILMTFWNSKWADRIKRRYPPITLSMLDEVIQKKKWVFD
jgi:hypothetical protein